MVIEKTVTYKAVKQQAVELVTSPPTSWDEHRGGSAELRRLGPRNALEGRDKQKIYTLGKSYDTVSGKIVTMTGKRQRRREGAVALHCGEAGTGRVHKDPPLSWRVRGSWELWLRTGRRGPRSTPEAEAVGSLAPIKEAGVRRQSPEDDAKGKRVPRRDAGLEGPRLGRAEPRPRP